MSYKKDSFTEKDLAFIRLWKQKDLTIDEIAETLKINKETVIWRASLLRKSGIPLHSRKEKGRVPLEDALKVLEEE